MNIEVISGSGRENSITIRVAYALQNWLREQSGHQTGLIDCATINLPVLQSVIKSVDTAPPEFRELTHRIFSADAFIWVTPEYNGSYSPALKNLVDHFPKQLHKPIGIVTASNGSLGGMRAAQQMILLATAIFAIPSPQLLIVPQVDKKFDASGKLLDDNFYKNIHNFVSEFLWLAEKLC